MFTKINSIISERFHSNRQLTTGLYQVLFTSISEAIEAGDIPESSLMPPTRLLAEKMGLSRSTVVKAYNLLAENKILISRHGSGYMVATFPKSNPVKSEVRSGYPLISEIGKSFHQNIHLLGNTETEGMAFTPGLPPLDVFPIGQWQKLTNMYWRHIKSSDLNYSISSGIYPLKKNIANYLLLHRRIHCDPDEIIIVSGSLQSLYLIGTILLNKGDQVLVENPTFPNVISIFKSLQARVHAIPVDEEGILPENIHGQEYKKAKLIHTTPSNQYPLGGKMSLERRLQLLHWANENESIIIENDYEHEINNWENPIDSIYSLDRQQRTVYLGTFNRILHPSIRLGYMVAPPYLLEAIKALQMHSHRFVPQSIQAVMTDFMAKNLINKHIRNAIDEAQERKTLFVSLFEKLFAERLVIRPNATPSFHVVAEMNGQESDEDLVATFKTKRIITHPLTRCYLESPKQNGLIMGYSCINKVLMAQYLQRMANAFPAK